MRVYLCALNDNDHACEHMCTHVCLCAILCFLCSPQLSELRAQSLGDEVEISAKKNLKKHADSCFHAKPERVRPHKQAPMASHLLTAGGRCLISPHLLSAGCLIHGISPQPGSFENSEACLLVYLCVVCACVSVSVCVYMYSMFVLEGMRLYSAVCVYLVGTVFVRLALLSSTLDWE